MDHRVVREPNQVPRFSLWFRCSTLTGVSCYLLQPPPASFVGHVGAGYRTDGNAAAAPMPTAVPQADTEVIRVPNSIHDVDNGKILGFGADLAEDHPVSFGGLL